jgi:exo-beta-1,3-glucanase (GH17 family)
MRALFRFLPSRLFPWGLFSIAAALILAAWWWLGMPVQMPPSPLAPGEKLYCLSYAPYRPGQNPLYPDTQVDRLQIEQDLQRLAGITRCVRTYAADMGQEYVPEIARRYGLKVLQGLWLSRNPADNQRQIEATVALANQYPDVIEAVVVGNEVLLRGDMSAADLAKAIRAVKARVRVPVTYADVWEFWLRNREIADAVDFVTVHILPYWEDFPIPAAQAAAHVVGIRRQVAEAFPGKDILIGETGWPSEGRMREGALPSPVNQARVLHDVLAAAKGGNFHVNLIEAFDQPWKRYLEGTVGGYWGLFNAYSRQMKFAWGGTVSNHPYWPWQAAAGIVLALLTFAAAVAERKSSGSAQASRKAWIGVAAMAAVSGILVGWTLENVLIESLGFGGWIRALALAAASVAAPPLAAGAMMAKTAVPSFAKVLARAEDRVCQGLPHALGVVLIVVSVLALVLALGLVFDPRYRDFAFAPLTAAVAPYAVLASFDARPPGARGTAETLFAAALAACALYIIPYEGLVNWQALWCAAALICLTFILLRSRDAPG